MGLYLCSACGHIAEAHMAAYCQQCAAPIQLYDSMIFIRRLLSRYALISRELYALQQAEERAFQVNYPPPATAETKALIQALQAQRTPYFYSHMERTLKHNLKKKGVHLDFEHGHWDFQSYADEVAWSIMQHRPLLQPLLEALLQAYAQGETECLFSLKNRPSQEAFLLNRLAREWYGRGFFQHYRHLRSENALRLKLISSPKMQSFFAGRWRSYYAMGVVLNRMAAEALPEWVCAQNVHLWHEQGQYFMDVLLLHETQQKCYGLIFPADESAFLQAAAVNLPFPMQKIFLWDDVTPTRAEKIQQQYGVLSWTLRQWARQWRTLC